MGSLLLFVAQIETDIVAQYGLLGAAVLALAAFARQAYTREANRADRLEDELIKLNQKIQGDVVPLLTRVVLELEKHRHNNGGP